MRLIISNHPHGALSPPVSRPRGTADNEGDPVDQEPFCAACGAPVGIFLAHGKDYRHYRGVVTATSTPRPYKADHAPVIAWRPAGR